MITEILTEMGHDIAIAPMRLVAESAQFVILVALIWVVAFGFGKRKGFVANMLTERRARVATELEEAQGADERLLLAEQAAREREGAASEEVQRLLSEAKESAEQTDRQVRSDADAEAARILDRARTALENERAQMQADLRERLVELVSQASRAIMNEKLTVAEQRAQIEQAIIAGVKTASETAAPPSQKRRVPSVARTAGVGPEVD